VFSANRVRLGRWFGIEVNVDYSWFVVFFLVTFSLASEYFPQSFGGWPSLAYWLLGGATALLFFLSVLAHELAHSVVSQALGTPVEDITLFIFGGAARISDEPRSASEEFWMALVGPLTSLVLAACFGAVWLASGQRLPYIHAVSMWLTTINLSVAVFNLIPGFPLDGGRVFRSIVWAVTGDLRRSTRVAVALGRLVAYGFILLGIVQAFRGQWVNGVWMAFIGLFIENAAMASYRRVALREMLAGHTVRDVMTADCAAVPSHLTLDVLVEGLLLPSGKRCFPVREAGHAIGLLTIHHLRDVPREEWPTTRVSEVMIPWDQLKTADPDEALEAAMTRMGAEDVNQLVVVQDGELVGMVARDGLLDFIRRKAVTAA